MNDLLSAIKFNDIAAVESLLADGAVDVNARIANHWHSPLLVLAAELCHVEIVTRLLDEGAQIDAVDDDGDTACHEAARHNRTAVVELLVARNANLSLRNQANQTPIDCAILSKNERLVMLLIDATMAAGTPLDDATTCRAAALSADVIRLLLFKHRIDLSAIRDSAARTPLHQAAWHSTDASVFKMLIEVAGIDVDARDRHGATAARIVCRTNDAGALVRLIAGSANLNLADDNGQTPLHICVIYSIDECAIVLLAAGADVHARDVVGRTACHYACEFGRASLPGLLAFGANLDEPDNDGVTPRQLLNAAAPPTPDEIETARRRVFRVRLSLVRQRAFEVCVAFQSLGLDALCMCELLLYSCGPVAPLIPFHIWWLIATKVKHWQK